MNEWINGWISTKIIRLFKTHSYYSYKQLLLIHDFFIYIIIIYLRCRWGIQQLGIVVWVHQGLWRRDTVPHKVVCRSSPSRKGEGMLRTRRTWTSYKKSIMQWAWLQWRYHLFTNKHYTLDIAFFHSASESWFAVMQATNQQLKKWCETVFHS